MKLPASILQSTSWSPPTRRMLLTLVPILSVIDEPLTFRSLINTTASPLARTFPLASLTAASASSSGAIAPPKTLLPGDGAKTAKRSAPRSSAAAGAPVYKQSATSLLDYLLGQ